MERYMAVYNPYDYNRRQQDSTSQKNHVLKYVLSLIGVSFIFNISKFFESKIVYFKVENETFTGIDVTDLR